MKIYTKTGDDGTTGLIGGSRVQKNDLRIECYGTVDELNAAIGWAAVTCDNDLLAMLRPIQNELFVIGSQLAMPDDRASVKQPIPELETASIARMETQIDAGEARLSPLKQFILPGGTEAAARLHLCRTICRRAERLLVDLAQKQAVSPVIVTYLNRLSDWLFVHARLMNREAGIADIPWTK